MTYALLSRSFRYHRLTTARLSQAISPQLSSGHPPRHSHSSSYRNKAFTLLEVIITLALLSIMMVSVSLLLRGSLDMRLSLSDKATVNSRVNIALERLKRDLEHAYFLSLNKDKELFKDGVNYTFFKVTRFAGQTTISFTAMVHPSVAEEHELGELQRVYYELKESERYQGRNALYRGSLPVGTEEEVSTRVIAEGIKTLNVEMWTGSDWSPEWDTEKSDYRDFLPPLVQVQLTAYLGDPEDEEGAGPSDEEIKADDLQGPHPGERRSIVYLPWAKRFGLLKPPKVSREL